MHQDHRVSPAALALPVEGEPLSIETPEGTVRAYVLGTGRTTLVLHSFNAAGSGEEVAELARSLSATRRVVLVDWLGFGTSDRPDVRYGPALYERHLELIRGAALLEQEGEGIDTSVDVVALSLPSQYIVVSAVRHPERFRRCVLISPTGFGRFGKPAGAVGRLSYRFLKWSQLGRLLFRVLATRASISWFLRQIYVSDAAITDEQIDYAVSTTRQPGAWYAALRFVFGRLDDPRAEDAYRHVTVPVAMLFGDRPRFTDPAAARKVAASNPHLCIEEIGNSGDLPHREQPPATTAAILRFLDEAD